MLRQCMDCGIPAPEVPLEHASTLLSLRFGWRLRRRTEVDGRRTVQAQCPECFKRARDSRGGVPGESRLPPLLESSSIDRGELMFGFRDAKTRDDLEPALNVRANWLLHSQGLMKRHGLYTQYAKTLSSADREPLLRLVPETWCPMALALAHYEACERLALSDDEIVTLSAETGLEIQSHLVQVPLSDLAARGSATAWVALKLMHEVFTRFTDGGGASIYKLGPAEGLIEMVKLRLAQVRYFRVAMRGVLFGMVGNFAPTVVVREVDSLCTSESVGYHLYWGDSSSSAVMSMH